MSVRAYPVKSMWLTSVMVAQLSERSHLLNDAFQHRMLALIREHEVPDLEIRSLRIMFHIMCCLKNRSCMMMHGGPVA